MFCIKCGHELNDEDLFCGICGQKKVPVRADDSLSESSKEIKIIQKKEEKMESLIDSHIIVSLVFGVLCLSILIIFIISIFTHGGEDAFIMLM